MRSYILFTVFLQFASAAVVATPAPPTPPTPPGPPGPPGPASPSTKQCPQACTALTKALGASSIKKSAGSDAYWAAQIASIQAACYTYPANPQQVSTIIKIASQYQCQFAIRGSGHSGVAGASNLAGGIVLNLDAFNNVTLSPDKSFAYVGAGINWGTVYSTLDQYGYTVIGGRETTVGVGGLTLGGGISYFSGQYGFACDNVLAYEVVLGDGTIKTVSLQSDPALYHVLRGGGNNFAVVTQYHLAAYAYDVMQGGLSVYVDAPGVQAAQIAGFDYFVKNSQQSPNAAMFMSMTYQGGQPLWIDGLYYTQAAPLIPAVPAYKGYYTSTLNASLYYSTQRTGKHTEFATELGTSQPDGSREQFHTATYVANPDLLTDIYTIYRDVVKKTQAKLQGTNETFSPSLAFQPITTGILRAQQQRGGNVLGLNPTGPPLMIASMSWPWENAANDKIFLGGMAEVITRSNAAAVKRGLTEDFIYMNYAQTGSQVVQSYGQLNVAVMKAVSKLYDPAQVFQKLVPGGFKLPA